MKRILCVCILFICAATLSARHKPATMAADSVKSNHCNDPADEKAIREIVGQWKDGYNGGQKTFGVNIVVLKKIGNKWLIVAHEAAVPDPTTAIQCLDTINVH